MNLKIKIVFNFVLLKKGLFIKKFINWDLIKKLLIIFLGFNSILLLLVVKFLLFPLVLTLLKAINVVINYSLVILFFWFLQFLLELIQLLVNSSFLFHNLLKLFFWFLLYLQELISIHLMVVILVVINFISFVCTNPIQPFT